MKPNRQNIWRFSYKVIWLVCLTALQRRHVILLIKCRTSKYVNVCTPWPGLHGDNVLNSLEIFHESSLSSQSPGYGTDRRNLLGYYNQDKLLQTQTTTPNKTKNPVLVDSYGIWTSSGSSWFLTQIHSSCCCLDIVSQRNDNRIFSRTCD